MPCLLQIRATVIIFKRCDGKCLSLGTWKEKAYHQHTQAFLRDKSYTSNCPVLPPIDKNRWLVPGTVYKPEECLEDPALRAVIELTKHGCKSGCVGSSCRYYSNNLPCTPLCKFHATECANMIERKYESVISKTKIKSESEIRIFHVLCSIHFGQMMFLDCSYKYLFFLSSSFIIPFIIACLSKFIMKTLLI